MKKNAIVGSLSRKRLGAMLRVAATANPGMQAEIAAMGVPAAACLSVGFEPAFLGPRMTARSGDTWDGETVVRALCEVSREVESSKLGEDNLITVRNLEASLVQAALAEVAIEQGWARERAEGRVEWVQFDKLDPGWIDCVLQRVKTLFTGRAVRPELPDVPDLLPEKCKLALVGDWGTGRYGAPEFTRWASRSPSWAAIVHLGDTYYAGVEKEINGRLRALWPQAESVTAETLSRFLNGNHEMYSGGNSYFSFITGFKQAHPQRSSGFAMQNSEWLIIGLDTSWHGFKIEPAMHSGHLDEDQIAWLAKLVRNCGSRKVVLMSHHQPFHFAGTENAELTSDLQWLWNSKKVCLWYWGHEHFGIRFARNMYGFEGRCVGHGGMPETRPSFVINAPKSFPISGTNCCWKQLATPVGGQPIQAWVLDGPNPLIVGADPIRFAPHGWLVLNLNGPHLVEDWYLADGAKAVALP